MNRPVRPPPTTPEKSQTDIQLAFIGFGKGIDKKMKEFKIVSAGDTTTLSNYVQELLNEGWFLSGSLVVDQYLTKIGDLVESAPNYHQPMWKNNSQTAIKKIKQELLDYERSERKKHETVP